MKRKLPVLIAIVLALVIALAACQFQPVIPGIPLPSQDKNAEPTGETTLPAEPAITDIQPEAPKEAEKPAASTSSKSTASKQLTKDQAISKALSHAGLKKSQVSKLTAELDKDDGVTRYEVDFETADWEYEYEINAKTGKIIKAEKDRND